MSSNMSGDLLARAITMELRGVLDQTNDADQIWRSEIVPSLVLSVSSCLTF